MLADQRWLDTISNNIANANTTGFRRQQVAFGPTLEMVMRADAGQGKELGVISLGTEEVADYTVFEAGNIQGTGNPLDVAIASPSGMFAVETPQGTRYTRNGSFTLSPEGELRLQTGERVLDDSGQPIQFTGTATPEIHANGEITAAGAVVGKLGVFEGNFVRAGAGLFASQDAKAMDSPQLRTESIESSNVNLVEAMIQMISINRAFELAQRSIQTQDEQNQKLIQSLRSS